MLKKMDYIPICSCGSFILSIIVAFIFMILNEEIYENKVKQFRLLYDKEYDNNFNILSSLYLLGEDNKSFSMNDCEELYFNYFQSNHLIFTSLEFIYNEGNNIKIDKYQHLMILLAKQNYVNRENKRQSIILNKAKEFCPLMQNFLTNSLNKKTIKKVVNQVVNYPSWITYFSLIFYIPFFVEAGFFIYMIKLAISFNSRS